MVSNSVYTTPFKERLYVIGEKVFDECVSKYDYNSPRGGILFVHGWET